MNSWDERIKKAAKELAEALNEGGMEGNNYDVHAHALDVTNLDSRNGRQYCYQVFVREHHEREVAP
jgi:hypothetical protein